MLLDYPVCLVYEASTDKLKHVYIPDLNVKFFSGENIEALPLPDLLTELRNRMQNYLQELLVRKIRFARPSNIDLYLSQDMEDQKWLSLDVHLENGEGTFEKGLERGSLALAVFGMLLVAIDVLFASQITYRRLGSIPSIVLAIFSAITTFTLGLVFFKMAGVSMHAANIGSAIDDRLKFSPMRENLYLAAREVSSIPEKMVNLAESQAIKPESSSEGEKMQQQLLLDPNEEPADKFALDEDDKKHLALQNNRGSSVAKNLVKTSIALGLGGVILVDMSIMGTLSYQMTSHLGANAFDKKIPSSFVRILSILASVAMFTQMGVIGASTLYNILNDMEWLLERKKLAKHEDSPQELTGSQVMSATPSVVSSAGFFRQRTNSATKDAVELGDLELPDLQQNVGKLQPST